MRYRDLLIEDRTDALIGKYYQLSVEKGEKNLDPATTKIAAENRIKNLIRVDPTPQKRYADWIIRRVLSGAIQIEDAYKLTDYLSTYDRAKNRIPAEFRDINKIKDEKHLYDLVEPFIKKEIEVSAKAERDALDRRMREPDHATILLDDADLKIVVPHTEEASCYYGRNTQWCTAATNNNYFRGYSKKGPLYIILVKSENARYQLHFPTRQYMDERDRPIKLIDLVTKYPKIAEVIGEQYFYDDCLGLFLRGMTETQIKYTLTQNPLAIRGLKDKQQTPRRKIAAAKGALSPWLKIDRMDVFHYIHKPWPEEVEDIYWDIKLKAERIDIQHIPEKYLTEEVLIDQLMKNPRQFVLNGPYLTKKIVAEVLSKLPRSLVFVPVRFRTRDVLRMANAGHWLPSLYAHRLFKLVDPEEWPYEWVIDMIKYGEIAAFEDLPEYFQQKAVHGQPYGNDYVFSQMVETYGLSAVPKEYWSKHMRDMANHPREEIRQRWITPKGTLERKDPDNIDSYKLTVGYEDRWGSGPVTRRDQDARKYDPQYGSRQP